MRFAIVGQRGVRNDVWALPWSDLASRLEELGLPLWNQEDLSALQLPTKDDLGNNPWLFRGPFRPVNLALADTAFRLVAENSLSQRAAAVCDELLPLVLQPSLLSFYAAEFSAQEYSVHDTYLQSNPLAIEVSEDALEKLMELTLLHPQAKTLHRTWAEVGVVLVELREIGWIQQYFQRLWQELGWQDAEIRLALAHAAMEMLDFDLALDHIHAILAQYPDFGPALELQHLAEKQEQVPRDAHAGHNHGD